jgi:MFS family permease
VLAVSLVLCAASPEGSSWQIFAGLFLLGLGWSFATVSASTLIADHAPLEVRADVQGAADLVMGVTAAAAGGLAGVVVGTWGYSTLAWAAAALVVALVVAAFGAAGERDLTKP